MWPLITLAGQLRDRPCRRSMKADANEVCDDGAQRWWTTLNVIDDDNNTRQSTCIESHVDFRWRRRRKLTTSGSLISNLFYFSTLVDENSSTRDEITPQALFYDDRIDFPAANTCADDKTRIHVQTKLTHLDPAKKRGRPKRGGLYIGITSRPTRHSL